jgi:hypothetical protein
VEKLFILPQSLDNMAYRWLRGELEIRSWFSAGAWAGFFSAIALYFFFVWTNTYGFLEEPLNIFWFFLISVITGAFISNWAGESKKTQWILGKYPTEGRPTISILFSLFLIINTIALIYYPTAYAEMLGWEEIPPIPLYFGGFISGPLSALFVLLFKD